MTKDPVFKIRDPTQRIVQDSARWVEKNGIDRKIPAGSRFGKRGPGIGFDLKPPVPGSRFSLPAGKGNINVEAADLVDPERFSHRVPFADTRKGRFQFGGLQGKDFQIEIDGRDPQQGVPDRSADQIGTSTRISQRTDKTLQEPTQIRRQFFQCLSRVFHGGGSPGTLNLSFRPNEPNFME